MTVACAARRALGSRIKINEAERLDGRKITCRGCRYPILVRAPKARASRRNSGPPTVELFGEEGEELVLDALEVPESSTDEDEFEITLDDDEDIPEYRPVVRRPPAKKKQPTRAEDAPPAGAFVPSAAPEPSGKRSALLYVLLGAGVILLLGAGSTCLLLLTSGFGKGAKFEAPTNYVRFAPEGLPLSAAVPQDWAQTYAGGQNGIPISARFTFDSVSIDVRESIGGGALGQAGLAIQAAAPGVPKEAPVIGIHEYHRARFEEDYQNYNEGMSRPIKTRGYGEGRISDFTAKQGLFGSTIKGCRATVMNPIHQFTVTCKCIPSQFKDAKPVFEKIISSLSTGGD
jgi:hypothetical protein